MGPGSRYSSEDEDADGYGLRPDGTPKGQGWLGPLPMTDGSGKTATELTIGVDDEDIPLLVPTLTQEEIDHLLSGGSPTREIVDKAVGFAHERRQKGLSVYVDPIAWGKGAPGSQNFSGEDRWRDTFHYNRPGSRFRYTKPPVETEIRTFVPDPEQVGDFDFRLDDFEEKMEKRRQQRSTRL